MDVYTPTKGRDKTEGFAPEKRRMFQRGTLIEPYLGGFFPLHWNVGLGRPETSPMRLMMSSNFMDVLGRQSWKCGTCGSLERPKEG
jgi:hypothetical protein